MARQTTSSGPSRLGASVVIRGTIRGEGDLEIHGRVEGIVEVDGALDVEDSARIKSSIRGGRVTVRGAILGDVTGSESVVLESGARVVGDLSAPSIGIRPGGLLRGHVASGELAGATANGSAAVRTPAPRAVRQPPVAAPTKRDAEPPRPHSQDRSAEAPKPVEAKAEPPNTKPAGSPSRRDAGRAAQTTRSTATPAAAAPKPAAPPPAEDPLADLLRQAPPPIMPSLQRGAKASLKKKSR